MTQTDKNVGYVALLITVVAFSVPASRDYLVELVKFQAAMVWFGLQVIGNGIVAVMDWLVI